MCNPDDKLAQKAYKTHIQTAKRNFKAKNIELLEDSLASNPANIWPILKNINTQSDVAPDGDELLHYLKNVTSTNIDYFDYDFDTFALQFLHDYDNKIVQPTVNPHLHETLNQNFSLDEILNAITYLKNGKCPVTDGFPAELVNPILTVL